MRSSHRAQRIVVLPIEIAGVAAGLQQGLTSLGREVDVLLRRPHGFGYPVQRPAGRLRRLLWAAVELSPEQERSQWRRARSLLARILAVPVLMRYDAAVYLGSEQLFRGGVDRKLLRLVGVRVVSVFCGSDARPPYLSGRWVDPADGAALDLPGMHKAVLAISRSVRLAEEQSDVVVNHPATGQFHLKPYVDWSTLGMPCPAQSSPTWPTPSATGPVRVVHAPSVQRWKGTAVVRDAVTALRVEGLDIDYVELVDRPNSEVLAELVRADIVVDEVWSDALLAGLGTEAARSGAAVLVSGLAGDLVREIAGRVGAPHAHYSHPDELQSRLRELVVDRAQRRRLAAELHAFATGTWSPLEIARRYATVLDGDVDPSWLNQPDREPYVGGWGCTEDVLAAALGAFVERYGVEALHLRDASRLLAMVERKPD